MQAYSYDRHAFDDALKNDEKKTWGKTVTYQAVVISQKWLVLNLLLILFSQYLNINILFS